MKKYVKKLVVTLGLIWVFLLVVPFNMRIYAGGETPELTQEYGYKNLAYPDLKGKEYLGDGWYQLHLSEERDYRYNILNGHYKFNGAYQRLEDKIIDVTLPVNDYNISFRYVSGMLDGERLRFYGATNGYFHIDFDPYKNANRTLESETRIFMRDSNANSYVDYEFTIQIEKGNTATDYQVPIKPYLHYISQINKGEIIE